MMQCINVIFKHYIKLFYFISFIQVRFHGSSFTLWDVGGQDKLRPLWRSYTRCTDGIIFVVDSCKEDRLEEAKLELLKIYKSCSERKARSKHSLGNIPVLILANKQDLPEGKLFSDKYITDLLKYFKIL